MFNTPSLNPPLPLPLPPPPPPPPSPFPLVLSTESFSNVKREHKLSMTSGWPFAYVLKHSRSRLIVCVCFVCLFICLFVCLFCFEKHLCRSLFISEHLFRKQTHTACLYIACAGARLFSTTKCSSGTNLPSQLYVLSHRDKCCTSNLLSHPGTVHWLRTS